jgi:hypothetical protein
MDADKYRWTTLYSINTVFVLYIAIMKSPSRWSSEMDLALIKGMGQCLQQNNKDSKVIGNFKALLDSLCSAIDSVRRGETGATDAVSDNNSGAGQHINLEEATDILSLSQNNQVLMNLERGLNNGGDHQYGNGDASVPMNNFPFEDFFGNDPNALNMQFWPMDLV